MYLSRLRTNFYEIFGRVQGARPGSSRLDFGGDPDPFANPGYFWRKSKLLHS